MNASNANGSAATAGARPLQARAFGLSAADLDIDFAGAARVETVTALLANCLGDRGGEAVDTDEIWGWSLGERLQHLLAVRLAGGGATIEVQAPCAHCAEPMAIELDLHAFTGAAPEPSFRWRSAGGDEIELRLPTGRDLRGWQRAGLPAPRALVGALALEALSGPPSDDEIDAIEQAFEAQDPLVALYLHADCPACGRDNEIDCDLEALLLAGFARVQARLLDELARLAVAFHWSEAQILALPPWRRAEYLRRLDAGGWL